jgi:hypothetical protein
MNTTKPRDRLVALLEGISGVERVGPTTTVAEAVSVLPQFQADLAGC